MSKSIAASDSERRLPVRRRSVHWVLAATATINALIFTWMAPRGFEFTDEAYYLLNYLHWRSFEATVTFFGAVFEWPYRALGQSLPGIRLFGFVLLTASAMALAWQWMRWLFHDLNHWGSEPALGPVSSRSALVLAAACAASAYYSHLTSLRAPSYNLLVLAAAMASTALLLKLLCVVPQGRGLGASGGLAATAFGATLTLASLGKPTAGIVMAVLHLGVVACAPRAWQRQILASVVGCAVVGTLFVLGLLHLLHPDALSAVLRGRELLGETDARGIRMLLDHLRWDLQRLARDYGLLAILIVALCALIHRAPACAVARAPFILAIVAATVLAVLGILPPRFWWPLFVLAVVCTMIHAAGLPAGVDRRRVSRISVVMGVFALAPLGLSFGTNMPVLEHSRIFAPLALIGLMGLQACLAAGHAASRQVWPLAALVLLALPWTVLHVGPAVDAGLAYRQRAPLSDQNTPLPDAPGARGPLWVDALTASDVAAVRAAAAQAGFRGGMPLLDLTGDGPGWVVLLGGAPVGVPWLLGGYEGSDRAAQRVLNSLPRATLQSAWLLTSEDGQRALHATARELAAPGATLAHERVAQVMVHPTYAWRGSAPATVTLQVWRPLQRLPSP